MVDYSVWLTRISWGYNSGTGSPNRYRVDFLSSARSFDTASDNDMPDNQIGKPPQETRRLDEIQVCSNTSNPYGDSGGCTVDGSGPWQLVRKYRLTYEPRASSMVSDKTDDRCEPDDTMYCWAYGVEKVTLQKIERIGNDGASVLPAMSFVYGRNIGGVQNARGTAYYPDGAWNRLTRVGNGYGGRITFNYETIGAVAPGNQAIFKNNRRITSKVVNAGHPSTPCGTTAATTS